ncbi:response regulator [Paenibacillus sp. MER TA 81-3]|uniref:response regulator transcription factor n=1 Tax=Paenibacillus sp. MER TA 81-3 TaxID=2939573 RepID=UPI00203FCB04|nr:response regulator [Paenibacillus sp. MER TA 81-3]MCM3340176.1 response regulator [Paenibacillus sp. MER TA 81-3]
MKLLIVDDEVIIRTGLAQVIPWHDLGFEVLPPCASAEEAMEAISADKPHLVLTDIRMTGADGLTLAAYIREVSPDTEMIVLTGYDDFRYAQRALREGVCDYLLKTSRPDDIMRAAIRAKERIVEKLERSKSMSKIEATYREQLLHKLLHEPLSEAECRMLADTLLLADRTHSSTRNVVFDVACIQAEGWGEAQEKLLLFAVGNMLTEMVAGLALREESRLLVLRLTEGTAISSDSWDYELALIERKLKCRLFAGIGRLVTAPVEVRDSCRTAKEAYAYHWFKGNKRMLTWQEAASRAGRPSICTAQDEAELIRCLKSGEPEELRRFVHEQVQRLIDEPEATPASVQSYGQSLLIAARRWLERCAEVSAPAQAGGLQPADSGCCAQDGEVACASWSASRHAQARAFGLASEPASSAGADCAAVGRPEPALASPRTAAPEQWERALFIALQEAMQYFRDVIADSSTSMVTRAMNYIREKADGSLTLQHVARVVGVHPNHLSDRFKQETGINYIEYVTQARMAQACRYFQDGSAKVSAVAQLVGYEDLKYFSQLFKKHIGCTPSEYRDKC